VLAALALGACGALPEPRIDTTGVDKARFRADLAECEAFAREAELEEALEIPGEDRPVSGGERPGGVRPEGAAAAGETGAISRGRQLRRLIENCMADRGYRILDD